MERIRRHFRILAECTVYALSGWLVLAFEAPILHGFEMRLAG